MRDLARANKYLGGTRSVLGELHRAVDEFLPRSLSILDVGTGAGDMLARVRQEPRWRDVRLDTIGLDMSPVVVQAARLSGTPTLHGDARALPFLDKTLDVVMCSQLLHHFSDDDAILVLREMDRVARLRAIVCDLRRSRIALAGFWAAARVMAFHRVSQHDGLVSVRRGFTPRELAGLVQLAVGSKPEVRKQFAFRLSASWAPACRRRGTRARPHLVRPAVLGRDRSRGHALWPASRQVREADRSA